MRLTYYKTTATLAIINLIFLLISWYNYNVTGIIVNGWFLIFNLLVSALNYNLKNHYKELESIKNTEKRTKILNLTLGIEDE